MIVWIGPMNILVVMEKGVRSSHMQWNAMNIYVLKDGTHAVMGNVLIGRLEWHFNE